MIHLLPNTSSQVAYFSPFSGRKFLPTFAQYLLVVVNQATEETTACILDVVIDNARYTKVDIGTAAEDAAGGTMLLPDSGLYTYTIYGQNSTTNTDPTDLSVVGSCTTGTIRLTASAAWDTPAITIPDNVIYYE